MTESTPKTLQELHQIREQITRDYQGLSAREFVERLHREVETFLKERHIQLKPVQPPAKAAHYKPSLNRLRDDTITP